MTSKEALEELKDSTEWTWIDAENYEIVKKDLEDFEWLKSILNLAFIDSLSSPEDKERLLEIMGVKISYDK